MTLLSGNSSVIVQKKLELHYFKVLVLVRIFSPCRAAQCSYVWRSIMTVITCLGTSPVPAL